MMAQLEKVRAGVKHGVRFAIVGLIGMVIYAGTGWIGLWLGAPILLAHAIAYVVSIVASYFGQKILTFGVRGEHPRFGTRFAVATCFLAASQFILVAALERVSVPPEIVLLISTLYYPPASFVVHTFWTFRSRAG